MKAVLLCAGFGTRMYPLTHDAPKALLPVAGTPVAEHLVTQLDETGRIDELVVVSNHRFAERFRRWCRRIQPRIHAPILVLDDGAEDAAHRRGATGDLAWAVRQRGLGSDSLLVAATDNLFRFDMQAFLDDHRGNPRNLVLRCRERDRGRLRRTGVAECDAGGRLLRLVEKPRSPASPWSVPALYLLGPDALGLLDSFVAACPEADAIGRFIAWLAGRVPVFTHEMRGRHLDVGDLASYRMAEAWLAGTTQT